MPSLAIAAYGIYQGAQQGKAADKTQGQRDAANQQSVNMSLEDRNYYRQKFGPMNQMLVDYAMGNKPSPYLAQAKGQVEQGYQQGITQLNEIQGRDGLGQSGIGAGQKIGLNMERAKTEAGLDLQDQAQRYGVAQSLSSMENQSLVGSGNAAAALGQKAGYNNQDMNTALGFQGQAFGSAAQGLGSGITNAATIYGKNGGSMTGDYGNAWLGTATSDKQSAVEAGGKKA